MTVCQFVAFAIWKQSKIVMALDGASCCDAQLTLLGSHIYMDRELQWDQEETEKEDGVVVN